MTETQFRDTQQTRDELREILSHPTFREALTIIITKRRIMEQEHETDHLDRDALQSLRLFNRRLGMEEMILSLYELTTPPVGSPKELESDYGEPAALAKLQAYREIQNLQDANTQ